MSPPSLPSFENPPVDEVVLGVEYEPIVGWKTPHAGLFWHSVKSEYPLCDVQPPAMSHHETFPLPKLQMGLRISNDPNAVRCWLLDGNGNNLIQIQSDRFLRNWRRVKGDEAYPRYPQLRSSFLHDWSRFRKFLADNQLIETNILQCEVTYINHVELGRGWTSFADLANVTPLWNGKLTKSFLPSPESANIDLAFAMDQEMGRLRVSFQHGFRLRDSKEILRIELAARGRPRSSSEEDAITWLDEGRKWIVQAFTDLTTPAMHAIWGKHP